MRRNAWKRKARQAKPRQLRPMQGRAQGITAARTSARCSAGQRARRCKTAQGNKGNMAPQGSAKERRARLGSAA
eukprot:13670491-Alexandrium_andersonii.AAC.1